MPTPPALRLVCVSYPPRHPSATRRARRAAGAAFVLALSACAQSRDGVLIAAAGNWDAGYGEMNKRGIELAVERQVHVGA